MVKKKETPGVGHNSGKDAATANDVAGIAADRLLSFLERIERLIEEKKEISKDIKDVFAEAKGTGFDTKVMRKIIALRAMEKEDRQEMDTLEALYRRAVGIQTLEDIL